MSNSSSLFGPPLTEQEVTDIIRSTEITQLCEKPVLEYDSQVAADQLVPPLRWLLPGSVNEFGQFKPGFKEELFIAAELALAWEPQDSRVRRIEEFLRTMDAPHWPYSFESAWQNWRKVHRG